MNRPSFNRNLWMLNTIHQAGTEGLTFEEICQKWQSSGLSKGKNYPLRSFHNHRKEILDTFKSVGDMPFEIGMLTKQIENAQRKVESNNFSIRRHVLSYDDVMNMQREVIYGQRNQVLDGLDLTPTIMKMIAKNM